MRLTILTLLIGFSLLLNAQAYVPFPTDSAYWIDATAGGVSFPTCYWDKLNIEGDTTINGKNYHKLVGYLSSQFYCSPPRTLNPFQPVIYYPPRPAGYFRNDTANKKVYYKKDLQIAEVLLYDFDLVIGQMYPWTLLNDSTGDSTSSASSWRVDSISQGTWFGQVRDIYHINDTAYNVPTVDLIEGVGSSIGLLQSMQDLIIIAPISYYLLGPCWKGLDKNLSPCNLIVGEEETRPPIQDEWSFFYSKELNSILLKGEHRVDQLLIYNLAGQKVGEYRPESDQVKVNLKKGIYLLQAIDREGRFHSGKLAVN